MKPHTLLLYAVICGIFFFSKSYAQVIDVQGHRGCRGLMPENTIPAFLKAIDLGVTTLEMDAVISKDGKVVVSHEPFLSHVICRDPKGREISEEVEKTYNLYEMNYEEISQCDCGSRIHPDYPEQHKFSESKPLLSEVINEVEAYIEKNKLTAVRYNIETKSTPEGDGVYHPEPGEFVDLLMEVIQEGKIAERTTLQSFDVRTLQYAHTQHPDMELALLVGNVKSLKRNLETLGFVPEIYSPYYKLVRKKTVQQAQEKGMRIIPWTVNKPKDIQKMISLGVDGIISDYPDRVVRALQ